MKVVKVEILPAKDGEIVTATVYEQTKSGSTWKDGDKHVVKSGTPEASRSILLEDNDRLVIEGAATTMLVVDAEQSSAHEVPIPQPEPEAEPKVEDQKAPKSSQAVESTGAKASAEPTPDTQSSKAKK